MTSFAADNIVLPEPGAAVPDTPRDLIAVPAVGRLRLSWADGVPGGVPARGAAGYEVRWEGGGQPAATRLVTSPDTQLDGLVDGQEYRIEVRSVDPFGRRSAPATARQAPGRRDSAWRNGLTGLFDEFRDDTSLRADVPGSLWHLSGYRGCVDLGSRGVAETGLPVDLGCGADEAVLRARQPVRLLEPEVDNGELARFAVLTDAAGPGGRLTLDLVPGPADRVGAARGAATAGPDQTLPAGTVRAVVDDAGARVNFGADLDPTPPAPAAAPPPRRGAGVLHLFELRVTVAGVTVSQDGRVVAAAAVAPRWREASALVGVRGPDGRRSRVHLAAAGFSGAPAAVPPVVEVPVNVATRQVLTPEAPAPASGISRRPLTDAQAARVVVTMATSAGMDAARAVVQLGARRLPARLAAPGPPVAAGSAVTVVADVPPTLLGTLGPDSLSPFVVRVPGAGDGAQVQESYLEIVASAAPGPPATTQPARTGRQRPDTPALPTAAVELGDSAGKPLTTATVAAQGRLVVTVALDGAAPQWDTGGLEGVQGFQLWLDGRIVAGLPTSGAPAGRYALPMSLTSLASGQHTLELRVFGVHGAKASVLARFTVV
ncbi:hypothetical protein [Actinokineospora iranica]|uniref:hypothetical protein n=1 Tax=Actinokineospora iranica TaxID=1271860 RepID=UPI000B88F5A2|nr:hypothetical protein [Actinokineospora iranica]